MDTFYISVENASVHFRNKDTEINCKNRFDESLPHYRLFHQTLNFLSSIGFTVTKDPRIEENYKCLSKYYRYGRKGSLEFKAERFPAGFKIEFYQNVVHENPHGGEYDFDKFEKMPYLIKKQFLLTSGKIRRLLLDLGYEETSIIEAHTAEEIVKRDFMECCHHPQKDMNFSLSDYDGFTSTMPQGDYSDQYYDRDKKLLHNGEVKYFRDCHGYLCRGRIYHRINMMFWIIINSTESAIRADYVLFDLGDNEPRKRVVKSKIPKEYTEKVSFLAELTTKELEREIKKRRKLNQPAEVD